MFTGMRWKSFQTFQSAIAGCLEDAIELAREFEVWTGSLRREDAPAVALRAMADKSEAKREFVVGVDPGGIAEKRSREKHVFYETNPNFVAVNSSFILQNDSHL